MTVREKAELIVKDIKKEQGTNPVVIFKHGPRCCKRDAMIAFKNGIDYVNAHYGVTLQYEQMQCGFTDFNEQCIKERCPFHE